MLPNCQGQRLMCWPLQVSMMYELMAVKKEDDEFVLQIAHSLTSLLACQATRSVLLDSTQVYSMHHIKPIIATSCSPGEQGLRY